MRGRRPLDASWARSWAEVLITHLGREFPNKIAHELASDADVAPPRALTPVFFGCYDWHSAVHSHWALVRLRRAVPALGDDIARALDASLTDDGCAAEEAYLARRPGFELPYGIAWLLTLAGELALAASAGDDAAARWHLRLTRLETLAARRFTSWLTRLPAPIRAGEHSQSAFAMSLVLDWARARGEAELAAAITASAEVMHGGDRGAVLGFEPSAHDFLSPTLGVAALMARIRPAPAFASWLDGFCPDLGHRDALAPVVAVDRADGKLVHWDGLNLSRAWMLAAIAGALPVVDARVAPLHALAARHGEAGVAALGDATYMGSHWLPTFALYWLTGPLAA